jgi:hypothetical protein
LDAHGCQEGRQLADHTDVDGLDKLAQSRIESLARTNRNEIG